VAKITPVINGDFAPVHGSFIIGPGLEGALDFDGFKLHLRFASNEDGQSRAETKSTDREMTLTMINPSPFGSALDLEGFRVDGKPVKVHLSVVTIGSTEPHRVVTYTLSAASL
jgi:hypothetical protein